ncbi:MAG: non-ribosomal peptide synthetase [Candidatus Pristimantibacillus lignocellulolyticus]|uniref:Non-ribosomal peptide synthetase n=1 Tax=Candidatus Pristimantibacillus lignocellulolyticus TaxID=2994561 RepID=A0A9J6ZC72_9BACL|nr:MAG: non-ribosomal peptide synthetase [Candidatus Pristimantibacillus lignocellulolyticus]
MQVKNLIHQLFEQQTERTPNEEAVRFEGKSVTYDELNRRANLLAYRLRSLRVGPDILVGISMERSIEMVVALYAVLKAGGAYVPLDPDYPKDRLAYMINDSDVRLVITQRQFSELLDEFDADVLILDEVESSEGYREEQGNLNITLDENNLAYMFYTSGSTGKPKGAMNTHAAIRNRVLWLQSTFLMTQNDRLLQKSPYSFDVSVWEFFWPHMCGASLIMAKPQGHLDTSYLWDVMKRESITFVQFVPTMLQTFLSSDLSEDLPLLKHVFLCGEPLSAALNERFCSTMSGQLHNLYGPTEAAVFVTSWTSDRNLERSIIPIGKAISDDEVYVLNDRYEQVSQGEIGELFISGIGLARGYHGRPDLTAERFVPDLYSKEPGSRMYHTGDLGRWLSDGNLECLGRNDDQVKVRGFRIELGEISNVLEQHPGVNQVVTVVREDQPGDQRITTYFIPNPVYSPSISELRNYLQKHLPDYMIPSYFIEMETFPLTPSGKTDRKLLPSPTVSRLMISQEYVPPQTYIQKELAQIWSGFFNFDEIGLDDNFIDLGGHSLVATQILVRCGHLFGVKVSLKDMLTQGTTIRSLAAIIETNLLADTDDAELEALLSEMEHLSEAEIEALLK